MVMKKRNNSFTLGSDNCNGPTILKGFSDGNKGVSMKRPLHSSGCGEVEDVCRRFSWWGRRSNDVRKSILPTWLDHSCSQSDDEHTSRRSRIVFSSRKRSLSSMLFSTFVLGFIALSCVRYYDDRSSMREVYRAIRYINSVNEQLELQVISAEADVRVLQREVTDLLPIHDRLTEQVHVLQEQLNDFHAEHHEKLVEHVESSMEEGMEQVGKLKNVVQDVSRRAVESKWGPGPHRVRVDLDFDDGPNYFIVEMAPLDLMPHSVHLFLDMVSKGLWDGCSFVMNAMHVLKVAPVAYDDKFGDKTEQFEKSDFITLTYQEYHEDFPHKPYTLGFAGHPGGPSWYINTVDNTDVHGPGEQSHHLLEEAGDPCFGTIVEGIDAVKRLEVSPTQDGVWFKERVGIKKATVMPSPTRTR